VKPELQAAERDRPASSRAPRRPAELTEKEKLQRKNAELQKAMAEAPPAPKTSFFNSDGGCLQDRRGACKGTPIRMGRWKGHPNFTCACGFTALAVSAKVLAAAKKADLL